MVYILLITGENMLDTNIEFKIKKSNDIYAIEVYRSNVQEDGTKFLSYIDSFHPMNSVELLVLKNFLQEYLHNNDWY